VRRHTTQTEQVGVFPCRGWVAPCQRAPSSIKGRPLDVKRCETKDAIPLVSCNSDSRNKSLGMWCESPLCKTGDGREDLVRAFRPDERRGLFVADVNELPNGAFEFGHTPMRATPNLFGRQFAEPPLDEVQPRAVGRREVHWKRGRSSGPTIWHPKWRSASTPTR
jgi:hypothetical protein